ncbi:hypothetical protein WKH77_10360 [Acinetobacter baumannii]
MKNKNNELFKECLFRVLAQQIIMFVELDKHVDRKRPDLSFIWASLSSVGSFDSRQRLIMARKLEAEGAIQLCQPQKGAGWRVKLVNPQLIDGLYNQASEAMNHINFKEIQRFPHFVYQKEGFELSEAMGKVIKDRLCS